MHPKIPLRGARAEHTDVPGRGKKGKRAPAQPAKGEARSQGWGGVAERLPEYEAKRDFRITPEPASGTAKPSTEQPRFVVHKHDATRLHYDVDGRGRREKGIRQPNGRSVRQDRVGPTSYVRGHTSFLSAAMLVSGVLPLARLVRGAVLAGDVEGDAQFAEHAACAIDLIQRAHSGLDGCCVCYLLPDDESDVLVAGLF